MPNKKAPVDGVTGIFILTFTMVRLVRGHRQWTCSLADGISKEEQLLPYKVDSHRSWGPINQVGEKRAEGTHQLDIFSAIVNRTRVMQ